jgi:hypothetical protein
MDNVKVSKTVFNYSYDKMIAIIKLEKNIPLFQRVTLSASLFNLKVETKSNFIERTRYFSESLFHNITAVNNILAVFLLLLTLITTLMGNEAINAIDITVNFVKE